jgi:hypothetical protein
MAVISIGIVIPALAQTTGQGIISGVVVDPTGNSVVGASVTVKNTDTNVSSTVLTNDTGYYEVRDINAGPYEVSASAKDFEKLVRTGIVLVADGHPSVNLALHLGNSSQTITVSGDAPMLENQSVSITQVLSEEEVASLPNGTSALWLAALAPGVQTSLAQNYQQGGGSLSWNGIGQSIGTYGRPGANDFSLDGSPNVGNGQQAAVNSPADDLAQQVMTPTAFDATVGHTYGMAITQATKSGTNDIHGTARMRSIGGRSPWVVMQHFQKFTYQYHEAADNCSANPNTAACKLDQLKFGLPGESGFIGNGGFGGPVFIPKVFDGRNKLFFYVGVINENEMNSSPQTAAVPSQQELTGDFSDLQAPTTAPAGATAFTSVCGTTAPYYGQYQLYNPYSTTLDKNGVPTRQPFCGNKIPANVISTNPIVKYVNSLWPAPTTGSVTGTNVNYYQDNNVEYRAVTNRYDYKINDNNAVFFRWTMGHYGLTVPGFEGNAGAYSGPRWIKTGALGWTHVLSSKAILNVFAGGTQFDYNQTKYFNFEKDKPSLMGFPTYLDDFAGTNAELPLLKMSGYTQVGGQDVNLSSFRTLSLRPNVAIVQGNHTMAMGVEWRSQNVSGGGPGNVSGTFNFDDTYTQQNNGSNGNYSQTNTGQSYAAFLLGVQTNATVATIMPTSRSDPYYAAYLSDTWRASRRLTIIPGIRYEFEFGPTEKHNRQIVGWNPTANLTIAPAAVNAYAATLAAATAAQKAVLPASLTVQGGPIYAGVDGASKRQWSNDWRVLPRIALAYNLKPTTVLRAGYGLFFDTLNTLEEFNTLDNDGYSTTTGPVNSSTVFGSDFVAGVAPLSNPFPVVNGSRFNTPIGNAAGADYYVGDSSAKGIYDHNRVPARSQRWQGSVEHQFGASTVLQLAYVGSWTTNITLDANSNSDNSGSVGAPNSAPIPASLFTGGQQPNSAGNTLLSSTVPNPYYIGNFSSLATSDPIEYNLLSKSTYNTSKTISVANLVRPYSQMAGLNIYTAIGQSNFQEFQANLGKRLSNGLVANVAFQKNYQKDRDFFNNQFDVSPSWESSNLSTPWRLTASGVYNLPFGRTNGKWLESGWGNALAGGWKIAATFELQPGNLLTFSNLFFEGNTNLIPLKRNVYYSNLSTGSAYIQGFNIQAATATPVTTNGITSCTYAGIGFVTNSQCQPNSYNLRVFPTHVEGVRQQGLNDASVNLMRSFHLAERLNFEARCDVFNVYNHQRVGAPTVGVTSTTFGQINSDNGNGRNIIVQGLFRF